MAAITAAVAVGVGAAASLAGAASARKAGKASAAAARERAKIAKLENARERRNTIREARKLQAQAKAMAVATGGGGGFGGLASSGVQGEVRSLQSQLGFNLGFLKQAGALNQAASNLEISATKSQSRAAMFGGIANTAFGVGSLFAQGG